MHFRPSKGLQIALPPSRQRRHGYPPPHAPARGGALAAAERILRRPRGRRRQASRLQDALPHRLRPPHRRRRRRRRSGRQRRNSRGGGPGVRVGRRGAGARRRRSSGFLPTYDVVGIPTMSYLPDVAYDVVGQDLRCRMSTTSYVMTYDIDIRHRMCPTYDVVTYDVHTISSKRTMSYVQTTMSYGFHRMRYRRFWTAHRM
mmetsp:Transcript_30657/g.64143  ORF Transcript_30657/g.64143 Transcript_30657/m.64143 type:complete len:201 (-) Transcript_30657:153-755(-)